MPETTRRHKRGDRKEESPAQLGYQEPTRETYSARPPARCWRTQRNSCPPRRGAIASTSSDRPVRSATRFKSSRSRGGNKNTQEGSDHIERVTCRGRCVPAISVSLSERALVQYSSMVAA